MPRNIRIFTVGKKSSPPYQEIIRTYEKRLAGMGCTVGWELIPVSNKDDESAAILKRLQPHASVWLLDERGQQLDNRKLSDQLLQEQELTIIIGGAYGVSDAVRERADFVWSLSSLVFPHQMVRLLVCEQIYRCATIQHGSKYHHG